MQPATMNAPRFVEDWPDHLGLPDKDDSIVENIQEQSQSNILTESIRPRLHQLHPEGDFCIACDVGIYFDYTDPVLAGCRAPDWFYVPNVPAMLEGKPRRSYVMWKELVRPAILIEYVSGDGSEERDQTPGKGKFWIYERVIGAGYYVIFDPWKHTLQAFSQNGNGYREMSPNEAGRFPIEGLNIELGIWDGWYREIDAPWLRVWDPTTGKIVPLADERIEVAEMALEETKTILAEQVAELETRRKRIDTAEQLATTQRQRADLLAAKLRALGIDPDA